MKPITTPHAPAAIGPYSQAIASNGFLFVSGQIPLSPATGKVEETSIEGQTHQVFANLKAVLEAAGVKFSNVVRTTVFLKSLNDFAKVNEIYATYFLAPAPARACVEVARLPRDVLVEIDCIAECPIR